VSPFASTPASRDRRARAYLILGVDPKAVDDAPRISSLIAKVGGGLPAVLDALRASDLPEARHFVSKYDNPLLPAYVRRTLPVEAFSVAAGLSPTRLWGVIAEVIRLQKAQLGAIKAAERHEAIVAVSSAVAETPEGVEDRMAHLKHMGFTPSPKGSTINIGINASANASAAAKSDATSLASPEDTIRRIVERRQQASAALASAATKELPAATASTVPQAFMPRGDAARVPVMVEQEYVESESDAEGDE
jgi:hypothetical protein